MDYKEKLHQILSSLWKNDDSVGKTYYNQALQDAQIAIDSLQEDPVSEDLEEASLRASIIRGQYIPKEYLDEYPYDAYAQSMFKRGAKWHKNKITNWLTREHDYIIEELKKGNKAYGCAEQYRALLYKEVANKIKDE